MTNLKILSDETLEKNIKSLVVQEREILSSVLAHLREVEDRKLHLKRGCSSLFDYYVRELKYSEASAMRRISTMRLSRELPQLKEKVESRALNLSQVSAVAMFIRAEEKATGEKKSLKEKQKILESVEGTSKRECEKLLFSLSSQSEKSLPKERERQVSPSQSEIRMIVGDEFLKKLEKLKSLYSHIDPDPSLAWLFEKAMDEAIQRRSPELKGKKTPPAEVANSKRYIPASLRAEVWKRDGGVCQHKDPRTGKICGSTHQLELDHLHPIALGGKTETSNLQLCCRAHNILRACEKLDRAHAKIFSKSQCCEGCRNVLKSALSVRAWQRTLLRVSSHF